MLGNLRVAITALLASYWLRNVDRNPRRNHEWQKSDNHRLGAEPPVAGTGHGPDKKGGLLSYWLHVGPSLERTRGFDRTDQPLGKCVSDIRRPIQRTKRTWSWIGPDSTEGKLHEAEFRCRPDVHCIGLPGAFAVIAVISDVGPTWAWISLAAMAIATGAALLRMGTLTAEK